MTNPVMNVRDLIEYNSKKVSMKKLLDVGGFNLALVCLDAGQEIPPHPEAYDAVFYLIEGRGGVHSGRRRANVGGWLDNLLPQGEAQHPRNKGDRVSHTPIPLLTLFVRLS